MFRSLFWVVFVVWEENSGGHMCKHAKIWVSNCLVQGSCLFLLSLGVVIRTIVVELDILCCGYGWGIGKGLCGCTWPFES